jgi:diguanylate cyclase (GGDEF)-like protein
MPTKQGDRRKGKALTDYFLHPAFYTDADTLHRARVLVSALYAFAALTVAVIPLLFIVPTTAVVRIAGGIGCVLTALAFVYLLFMLKLHGRYMLCASVAISIPSIAIFSSLGASGGILISPTAQLLALQPLVAFFFAGIRGGVMATIVIAALIGLLIAMHQTGVEFPQVLTPDNIRLLWVGVLLIGFFVIGVMALVYEFTSMTLRRERDAEHAKVVLLAHTDSLTNLANRRAFDNELNVRIDACRQNKEASQFTLCYLDLDGFKPINDQHGHDVGDQVLRAVSIRLRSALRGADLVGRQGGDEFMLLLSDLGAGHSLEAMAERFIAMIRQPIETSAGLVSVGASLGFAVYPQHATSMDALKKAADFAMYTAKRQRAGWLLYAPDMSGREHPV